MYCVDGWDLYCAAVCWVESLPSAASAVPAVIRQCTVPGDY